MMTDQPGLDLTQRSTFKLFTPVTLRFCDTDKLGHINNVAIASFFEASRCELIDGAVARARIEPGFDYVLARVAIDFRSELHYPGTVEVGGRFLRVGNRSILSGFGAFLGDRCFATGEAVNVFIDLERRVSVPVPGNLRRLLQEEIST
jgi:acyl-CoA thioester hydrolase